MPAPSTGGGRDPVGVQFVSDIRDAHPQPPQFPDPLNGVLGHLPGTDREQPPARASRPAHLSFPRASDDLKRTQMFMRHQSITTTADTYMHLDRDDLEEAMKLAYARWQELTAEEEAD